MLLPRWFSQTSCWLMFAALLALTASAHAQVPGQNNGRLPPRVLAPQAIEAGVALELYGHPDTAHRRIEVRLVNDRVELWGTVAAEWARMSMSIPNTLRRDSLGLKLMPVSIASHISSWASIEVLKMSEQKNPRIRS